ncbi:Major facilitator superfamily domain general substrate transporter [Penicillium bovifimosum]|uniref:Major facilitator superfamily domain general substrate transporter n=1 Tax=Penicillium bovifimosum TaxID=126998 RepID=A0A9W9LBS3_9EURO|nr:Major facilitator superfamily domain general substrate transporter [Penicillium bovifimosum]KAJ5146108.1 Major facilitator superfamily domain general substrate transporter [Penicillium bovifimosum]
MENTNLGQLALSDLSDYSAGCHPSSLAHPMMMQGPNCAMHIRVFTLASKATMPSPIMKQIPLDIFSRELLQPQFFNWADESEELELLANNVPDPVYHPVTTPPAHSLPIIEASPKAPTGSCEYRVTAMINSAMQRVDPVLVTTDHDTGQLLPSSRESLHWWAGMVAAAGAPPGLPRKLSWARCPSSLRHSEIVEYPQPPPSPSTPPSPPTPPAPPTPKTPAMTDALGTFVRAISPARRVGSKAVSVVSKAVWAIIRPWMGHLLVWPFLV